MIEGDGAPAPPEDYSNRGEVSALKTSAHELTILDLKNPTPGPRGELTNPRYRYVLIRRGEKTPFEKDWPTTRNYPANHPALTDHLGSGGNYAILCGYAGLFVVDIDDMSIFDQISDLLPPTRVHRSGSGRGRHYLYIDTEEDMRTEPLRSYSLRREDKTLLDVQGEGKLAVMPGSVHPSGSIYRTLYDEPIARLDFYALRKALHERIPQAEGSGKPRNNNASGWLTRDDVPLSRADARNLLEHRFIPYKERAGKLLFSCPYPDHEDKDPSCYLDPAEGNVWYCYGCKRGGDLYKLIRILEGLDHD